MIHPQGPQSEVRPPTGTATATGSGSASASGNGSASGSGSASGGADLTLGALGVDQFFIFLIFKFFLIISRIRKSL